MSEEKTGAQLAKTNQADSAAPDPAALNERAEAIDAATDGDGVARFDATDGASGLE